MTLPASPPFVPFPIDAFNPNYDGDHINIEVLEGATSVVTLNFNAQIVDPVLNFTDVDLQSTMVFTDTFTISTSGSNVTLGWPASTYTGIQYRTLATGSWQPLAGADPNSTTSWTGPRSMFGSHALFRGVMP